jgi:hypothetical protein
MTVAELKNKLIGKINRTEKRFLTIGITGINPMYTAGK